jgi:hypothetical protein
MDALTLDSPIKVLLLASLSLARVCQLKILQYPLVGFLFFSIFFSSLCYFWLFMGGFFLLVGLWVVCSVFVVVFLPVAAYF